MKLNLHKLSVELLNIAASNKTAEQLTGVEQRMLYNAVYCLNKLDKNLNKKEK